MKTKIKSLILFYIFFIFSAVLFESCCEKTYDITNDSSVNAYSMGQDFSVPATLDSAFVVEVYFEREQIASVGFISSASAFSCEENVNNPLVPGSFKVTLNKDIEFDGQTVEAGSNLTTFAGADIYVEDNTGYVKATFIEQFFQMSQINPGNYELTISGLSTNGSKHEVKVNLSKG